MSGEEEVGWRSAVHLSPQQVNEIIEEKLANLQPVLECALGEIERTRDALTRIDESWRELLARAKLTAA
jgi:hypothetical protein